ncbi:MAG: HpcH/HpaI aldolase family protein [Lysobacterales bacterium]
MKKKTAKAESWKNPAYIQNEGAATVAESLCRGAKLRRLVQEGLALGTFVIEQPSPSTLVALSMAGFDFVVLDMEHSAIGITTLETLIVAGMAAGLVVLVRPMGKDPGLIGKVLDMGAHGIMAPHVDTPERAREIVQAARFSPIGSRGFSPLTRFDSLERPLQALESSTYLIAQIEGKEALDRAREIAAVPGIDAIFVGPYDLSLSLGVAPGSPEVSAAAERLAQSVPDSVSLGIYVDDPADSASWAARRFALQCLSFDGRMLASGARRVVGRARGDNQA